MVDEYFMNLLATTKSDVHVAVYEKEEQYKHWRVLTEEERELSWEEEEVEDMSEEDLESS
jgi:hypothetical protein